jgi:hypothetical protein
MVCCWYMNKCFCASEYMRWCARGETGGLAGPSSGVDCMLLWDEGKLAGWKRGNEGSFKEPVLARREPLPCLECMARGAGGWRDSKREGS